MKLYDPFFYPDKSVLKAHYDFIACTERAEHFHDPFAEFDRLDSLLKPKGHPSQPSADTSTNLTMGIKDKFVNPWQLQPINHVKK